MKEWLCEPYEAAGYRFQGYEYQCPICGSVAHHRSLSAMKYMKRIKNSDEESMENLPYFWLVGCLNCADMIERAEKVKLIDLDGGSLREALKHFKEVCYCYDNEHLFNHGKMKTMKLLFEINGNEYVEQIKISFLHMVLFLKLWKGEL